MHNYKELRVWQGAIDLAVDVYETTATFPATEKYGLISQIRRACVSIPSNIAEGAGRTSTKEFSQFISIATGSAFELETQLIISQRLNLIKETAASQLLDKTTNTQKMLYGLKRRLDETTKNK